MAFTVRDYQDLLSLLNAHPEWREQLRRALLSDDFLALPKIVRELAEAQKRTEARVEELAEAQKRTEARVRELAEAQKRTDARLDRVENELSKTRSELGKLSSMIGASLEDEAGSVLATVMRQKGYRVLQDASNLRFNGEVDVVLPIEDVTGRHLWVLLEAKTRLGRSDVIKWVQRVRSAEWRQALQDAGFRPPYLAYAYGIRVDISAREAVQESGIGLMKGDGEVIAPSGEIE